MTIDCVVVLRTLSLSPPLFFLTRRVFLPATKSYSKWRNFRVKQHAVSFSFFFFLFRSQGVHVFVDDVVSQYSRCFPSYSLSPDLIADYPCRRKLKIEKTMEKHHYSPAQREERQRHIKLHMHLLEHASNCEDRGCQSKNCSRMKVREEEERDEI